MSHASRVCGAALIAAGLGGCQMLGGNTGVMPDSEVGLPPSERSALPGRQYRPSTVDADGAPVPSNPTRQLALPGSRGAGRSVDAGERRITREAIQGGNVAAGGASGSAVGPALTPSGGMGVGGKF